LNIKEIAEEAGVSIATVSRVINGKSDVSTETRTKILGIIKKREFKPKIAVNSVIDNIGVFISDSKTQISNPYSSHVLTAIADVVFNQDLSLTLIPCTKIPRGGAEFSNFCRQRRISGGIFISSNLEDMYIKELGHHLPIVLVGNDLNLDYIGSVRSDNYTGAYEAIKYLIRLNHKNILLVMADMHFIDHRDRFEGAKAAILEAGLKLNEFNIMNSYEFSDGDLSYKLEHILNSSHPDAIFGGGDQEAIRVMRVLQDKGTRIPEDISIVGYDNLPLAANTNPPLTTVNQPIYGIGKEAAKMLLNMINDRKFKPQRMLLEENHLMTRESVISRK